MSDNKIWKVYQYLESDTMKPVYTGQTFRELNERAGGPNGCNYWPLKYFGPAIQKYGFNYFIPVIKKEVSTKKEANYWEWYYTVKDNTQWPNGYNDSAGYRLSEQNKDNQSRKKKGSNNARYGTHHTEETKRKIGESRKGQPATYGHLGHKHSEESKKKNSEAHLGNKNTKGKRWFTNGINNVMRFECPENYWSGCTRFN